VVATTRPETMLGDTAVAVHPEDPRYRHLIGSRVAVPLTGRTVPIIGDAELVSMEFGTGAVKVTPAHDFNDYATGLRHGLPMLNVLDEKGRINQAGGPYAGLDRFEARKKIVEDLTAQGLLVEEKPHTVSLPLSQRSGVVVEPRLSRQWYLKVKGMAEKAVASVQSGQTRFVPAMWENVFFGWMNNIQDWCISRQLWWGHQIPAWYPRRPDGTVDWDTESPVVSAVKPPGEWEQDPDVLDTWFSSGLWPFSTLGWPDTSSPDLRRFYPNAVMETGHDIIFFWVARMMMMGLHFLGEVPFRVVYLHAMVRDEKGEKMSKVKGNVIDPLDIIRGATADRLPAAVRNKFPQGMPPMGADALRFTLASLTQQGRDIKLSVERIAGYRAFANKLWNAARFALMNLGDFRDDGTVKLADRPLSLADRWILSRLERTVVATRQALDGYQFGEAASGLYQFLWAELCDWYIELSKGALYEGDEAARTTARAVLVFVLDRVLRLLHPFMPFITEEIFEKLPIAGREASLCTAAYPQPQPGLLDEAAEATMAPLIQVIEAVRSIRGESNLSPALELTCQVQTDDAGLRDTLSRHTAYIVPLAGLSSLTVGPVGPKPPQSAVELRGALEISVPLAGVIDLDEEKARLGKEVARSQAELAGLEKRFDNPSYAARAPAEVVEKDRARIAELKARVVKLQQSITRLAAPSPAPDKKEG
jgi:valyl-tRNA synthetase